MASGQTYWFRPKRYGYGAEPSNWKGWLATAAYVAFVVGVSLDRLVLPATDGQALAGPDIALWIAVLLAVTLAFIWLCWVKTDGEWSWHWGKRD